MIQVAKITEQQAQVLLGMDRGDGVLFNPIVDANGNNIISKDEVDSCTRAEFEWVKTLPLIEFIPLQNDINI